MYVIKTKKDSETLEIFEKGNLLLRGGILVKTIFVVNSKKIVLKNIRVN